MAKLSVEGLSVRYGGDDGFTAVDGVSFSIPDGGTLGLVGESGSGKTSVGRAILGLVESTGHIRLGDEDYSARRARRTRHFRSRVQMVFQDPFSSLNPRMTVQETLSEAVEIAGSTPRAARRARAGDLLEMVELDRALMVRYPHEFSGGQLQRVAIARALALQPEVVIADEVTSALDVSVQATVLNLLRRLQRELDLSVLFISHNLASIQAMSDEVAVMYLGRFVETGGAVDLFNNPAHPYTRTLLKSMPTFGGDSADLGDVFGDVPDPRHPPRGCRFNTRCPVGPLVSEDREVCVARDPQEVAASRRHHAACHFADPMPAPAHDR